MLYKLYNFKKGSTFLLLGSFFFFFQKAGYGDGLRHCIRVTVCCGTAVLKVPFLLLPHLPWDADAGTSVGHSSREVVDAGGFVETCETPDVVLAFMRVVHMNVLRVLFPQLINSLLNVPNIKETCIFTEVSSYYSVLEDNSSGSMLSISEQLFKHD